MNRLLIIIGTICAVLWLCVTAITFGIPSSWCNALNTVTFQAFSDPVFQLANGFYYDVRNDNMPTGIFLFLFSSVFFLVFFLTLKIEQISKDKHSLLVILFFSLIFRIILWPGVMIHENDIYRYLWDGKVLAHNINPYKFAPSDLFMFEHGLDEDYYDEFREVWFKAKGFSSHDKEELKVLVKLRDANPVFFERIGHQQVPTIYPPWAQLIFGASSLIKQDSIAVMKMIFILFDVGAVFLIIGLLKHFKKSPCFVLIYGWSPLVLKEIANSGHYDSIAICFMVAGLYLFVRDRRLSSVCSIALSALSKFFAGVLLPVLARCFKWTHFLVFLGILSAAYLPFMVMGHIEGREVFTGLSIYNKVWSYNASIFALVSALFKQYAPSLAGTFIPAKAVVGSVYLAIILRLMADSSRDHLTLIHKCFIAIAALFIINPVGDPWYFCWVMPFLCIFPYRSWIVLSGLLMFSYINFKSDIGILGREVFHIKMLNWLIYVPFFAYLGIERFVLKRRLV